MSRGAMFSALRDHGLNPWRDVESLDLGDDATETIEAELASCSGVLLWLNEDVFSSDYVTHVELPAIVRAWSERRLRIVPVFDRLSPENAAERLSKFGFELGDSNGFVLDPGVDEEITATEIARRYVDAHVRDAHRRGERPVVRLVTYDDTAALRDAAVLNFDWRHQLQTGVFDAPSEQRLRIALAASTAAFKEAYGSSDIELAVKAHLPLAVALGHAFAEPTGCTLRMTRGALVFVTDRARGEHEGLKELIRPKGPITSRAAVIEVSVSRDIAAGVDAYIGEGHRYRHRIVFAPKENANRSSLDGSAAANVWARQISDALVNLSDRNDVDRVDLFLATPVELAIMIGWWTNAAGRIDLMNWAGKTGPYERIWSLP